MFTTNILINIVIMIAIFPILIRLIKEHSYHLESNLFIRGIIILMCQALLTIFVEIVYLKVKLFMLLKILMVINFFLAFACVTYLYLYLIRTLLVSNKVYKIILIIFNSLFAICFLACIILLGLNQIYYVSDNAIKVSDVFIVSFMYPLLSLMITFGFVIFRKMKFTQKIPYFVFCFMTLIGILVSVLLKEVYASIVAKMIGLVVIYTSVYTKRNEIIYSKLTSSTERRIEIVKSQLQPNFIFNTLSIISYLNESKDERCGALIDNFATYLRFNLDALTNNKLIKFSEELKHIDAFIKINKVRFGERLNIVYEINEFDFLIPHSTVLPFVHNAIQHGITKKEEGGTLILKTYKFAELICIEIIDDGVGFDAIDALKNKNNIQYIIEKIENRLNGKVEINSTITKGTKVLIIFKALGNKTDECSNM